MALMLRVASNIIERRPAHYLRNEGLYAPRRDGDDLRPLAAFPDEPGLVPLVLLWDRNWRAALWSLVFTTALVGVSVAIFGAGSWQALLGQAAAGGALLMMPTVFAVDMGALSAIAAMAGIVTNLNQSLPAAPLLLAVGLLVVFSSRTATHARSPQ
jgi:hypothetical protein